MPNAAASPAGSDPGPTTERVKVPLLAELLARGPEGRRRVWADLGSAQSGLVETLNNSRSRLIVADLPDALRQGNAQWHLPERALEPAFWSKSIDCFLCWDLLNYMSPAQLGEVSRQAAGRAGTECRLHALIQYSGTTMSEMPGRYALERDGQLRVTPSGSAAIKTPRYSPKALEKAIPDFRVERTMLLNNGMQEFLFSLR